MQTLADLDQTERSWRTDLEAHLDMALRANDYLQFCLVQNLDYERLDNIHRVPSVLVNAEALASVEPQTSPHAQNCQNELPAVEETAPEEALLPQVGRIGGRKAVAPPVRSQALGSCLPKKRPKRGAWMADAARTSPRNFVPTLSLLKERVDEERGRVRFL